MTTGIIKQLEQTTEILDGASVNLRSFGLINLFGSAMEELGDDESQSDILALGMSLDGMLEMYDSRYQSDVDRVVNTACIGNGRPDPIRVRSCVERYAHTSVADEYLGFLMQEIVSCVSKSLPKCDVDELEAAVMDVRDRLGYRMEAIASELNSIVHWEVDA